MTLHFTIGAGRLNDNGPPLVVALVNAKSASKPVKADILAQANLDGGGNTEKDDWIDTAVQMGLVRTEQGKQRAVLHYPVEQPEFDAWVDLLMCSMEGLVMESYGAGSVGGPALAVLKNLMMNALAGGENARRDLRMRGAQRALRERGE